MNFKFDFQGLVTAGAIIAAIAGFAFSLKGDVSLVQKDVTYLQENLKTNKDELTHQIKINRDELTKQIWSVDRKLNEITKTVVK
jgi:hypothetical protein